MYWLSTTHIMLIVLVGYLVGTIISLYLISVSMFGALVWLLGAAFVCFVGIFISGKNWNKKK